MEKEKALYTAAVITVSDKGAAGEREDLCGPAIADILTSNCFIVQSTIIVPEEEREIRHALRDAVDMKVNLIITTGGTGFSHRDITPEVTMSVIDREAEGIAEAIRWFNLQTSPQAMLTRGVSGIRDDSLIVNLPDVLTEVKESLGYIIDCLKHGIDILIGTVGEHS